MKYLKHINENLSNLDLKNLIEDEFQDITDFNKTIFNEINNHINIEIEYNILRNVKHDISFFNLEEKIIEEKKAFLSQLKKCINNVDKNLFSFESLVRTFDQNLKFLLYPIYLFFPFFIY